MIAALLFFTLLAQAVAPTPGPPPVPLQQNQAPVRTVPPPTGIPAIGGVDRVFALAALQGNDAEMDMAQLVLQRSRTNEVRQYAQKMMDDHAGLAAAMMPALTRALGASAPSARLTAADQLAFTHLASVPDPDVDQVYILQQIGDHLATLTAFRTEADSGTDAQLRALARQWMPTIQSHLELAVDLTQHIGGGSPFKSH